MMPRASHAKVLVDLSVGLGKVISPDTAFYSLTEIKGLFYYNRH
jgi:hypothetical protein